MTKPGQRPFAHPRTLLEALAAAPTDHSRGFRFVGIDKSETYYSFAHLKAEAERRARYFVGIGLSKGSTVALVFDDNLEFVLTFLGAAVAGLVPVPIHPRSRFKSASAYSEAVSHIIEASCARLLLTTRGMLPNVEHLVGLGLKDGSALERVMAVDDLIGLSQPSPHALPTVGPDDLCFLQFTSGSISAPKGVCVTHANLVANAVATWGAKPGLERSDTDVAVVWLPLFHDMGLIGFVLGPIVCNVQTVILPTEAFARRPNVWFEAISRHRGTITFAPNFAYAFATKHVPDKDLEGIDLATLRIAGCGAEPINPDVMRAFAARFAPVGFRAEALTPAYGMAESTLGVAFHPRRGAMLTDRVCASKLRQGTALRADFGPDTVELVSCGAALPGHSVRIVSTGGGPLSERAVGEIVIRGPSVSPGYFRDPDATVKTFKNGWLHTGDLGYCAEGNLYVCGRIKDLIIIRGAKYHPQDIEWCVTELPGVRLGNAAAFGVTEGGEERLVIAVEGNFRDADRTAPSIAATVRANVGITPDRVVIVKSGALPKTTSGKVQRQKTKQLYCTGQLVGH